MAKSLFGDTEEEKNKLPLKGEVFAPVIFMLTEILFKNKGKFKAKTLNRQISVG